ncbi:RNA-binding domain-containing protein [Aliarcobacter cryaerophilus]|uniref:RNA-binding domain-containing protein n=1 Tax=Aliarcobacter cryaerophilus TaxID=28198 RepID=UPI003DA60E42
MTCEELLELRENYQFEAKSAQGHNGNGEVPKDLWESYSAMANTDGGKILLGAKELKDGSLEFLGINNIDRVQKDFWTTVNNPQKVNKNILNDADLQVINCQEKDLILINIPRVSRTIKPIYIGQNPLTGTYLRYHDSDIKANEDIVKHFLADAINESNDTFIVEGFTMDDIDMDSLKAYRNIYKSTKLNHPWIELDDKDFLIQLGGYKKDRKKQIEGLTLAGLLMFGKFRSILDGVPNYLVDYQEQTENAEDRWIDRITTDGTWSGNLFDFSQKVYRKLTSELKVPFKLKDSFQRIDESNIHEAIREALINTLIHANYNGRIGIQVVKHPKGFSFRNPGLLRVSKVDAFKGGYSDCRNKTLQKMFQYIGMGEQAGSGFPKMLRAWMEQHWQYPYLEENTQLETTMLFMPTISLFPKEIQDSLEELFGKNYVNLDKNERLALILAFVESEISNIRLSDIGAIHPADTSKILRKLVDKQLLISDGIGRGMKYYINKNFNATVGKPLETVGKPLETVGKPLEQEIVILDYLKEHNKITTSDVKRLFNLKDSRSLEILRKMVDKKLINKLGSGRNTYYGVNND